MTELSVENIEDAFSKIRAEFEKRNNQTGLEILGSYEEQWNDCGSLSERQIGWIESQLNGAWRAVRSSPKTETVRVREYDSMGDADILDAMIERRLATEGMVRIDVATLTRLKRLISDLDGELRGIGI